MTLPKPDLHQSETHLLDIQEPLYTAIVGCQMMRVSSH